MKKARVCGLVCVAAVFAVLTSGCMHFTSVEPQPLFTASEVKHLIPFTVSFDGTLTYDPDSGSLTYVWTFGDGTTDTGPVVDHEYRQDGVYEVTLTVRDERGLQGSTSLYVEALNPPPVADFSYAPKSTLEDGQLIISASEWVTFDGRSSEDDEDVVAYEWYFGRTDSGEMKIVEGPVVTCRFRDPGTYSVILTVTDNDGASSKCIQEVVVLGSSPCNADLCVEYPWLYVE